MSQQGWECPKCGRVYAPWMPSCSACPGVVITAPSVTIECEHLWVSDTFGTRCEKCGVILSQPQPWTGTGDEIPPKYETTCADTEEPTS